MLGCERVKNGALDYDAGEESMVSSNGARETRENLSRVRGVWISDTLSQLTDIKCRQVHVKTFLVIRFHHPSCLTIGEELSPSIRLN